jgi:putative transposase
VLETALEAEITEHLGHERHGPAGNGNVRNRTRSKTVFTEVGRVEIDVPRDREGSFEPQIVKKRQRRLDGIDEVVLSLTARGLTTGEIAAHFDDVYGAPSPRTPSAGSRRRSRRRWPNGPTGPWTASTLWSSSTPSFVKVREGQERNKPFYIVLGVTVNGERDILGIWAGDGGGEGAKYRLGVLTEIKNRGVEDVCIAVCDGLKGSPEAITTVWEQATVQTCMIHLIRNTFRYAPRQHRDELSRDLKPVYTAPTQAAARERFGEFEAKWATKYPAIGRLWRNAWSEFAPFRDWDAEIRRVICSTNAIESLTARYRRAVRAKGPFPERCRGTEMPLPRDPVP